MLLIFDIPFFNRFCYIRYILKNFNSFRWSLPRFSVFVIRFVPLLRIMRKVPGGPNVIRKVPADPGGPNLIQHQHELFKPMAIAPNRLASQCTNY